MLLRDRLKVPRGRHRRISSPSPSHDTSSRHRATPARQPPSGNRGSRSPRRARVNETKNARPRLEALRQPLVVDVAQPRYGWSAESTPPPSTCHPNHGESVPVDCLARNAPGPPRFFAARSFRRRDVAPSALRVTFRPSLGVKFPLDRVPFRHGPRDPFGVRSGQTCRSATSALPLSLISENGNQGFFFFHLVAGRDEPDCRSSEFNEERADVPLLRRLGPTGIPRPCRTAVRTSSLPGAEPRRATTCSRRNARARAKNLARIAASSRRGAFRVVGARGWGASIRRPTSPVPGPTSTTRRWRALYAARRPGSRPVHAVSLRGLSGIPGFLGAGVPGCPIVNEVRGSAMERSPVPTRPYVRSGEHRFDPARGSRVPSRPRPRRVCDLAGGRRAPNAPSNDELA